MQTAAGWEWEPVCVNGELPCARDKHSAVAVNAGTLGEGGKLGRGPVMIIFGGFGLVCVLALIYASR